MATARSLLARARRLQDSENPVLAKLGGQQGWEEFQAEAEAGIASGRYDSQDMPVVVAALRGWINVTSVGR